MSESQQASGDAIDLCSSCGVVRLPNKTKCAHCNAEHGAAALTHPRTTDVWACVECGFTCRACGFAVPLNHLDMDGGVLCARCGLEQAFDVSQWRSALLSAHAVADLVGADLPGLDLDFISLGKNRSFVKQSLGGANGFEVTSSPGHPLCAHCHSIVTVSQDEGNEGDTIVTCATCNTKETYKLPATARKMIHGALHGVIATEHRSDRAAVKVEETLGAIAVRCPSCSAPLPASDSSKFLKCAFCDTVSRIPDHTWFRMSGKPPVSESMWLLFRGPSDKRKELEGREQKRHEREHDSELERERRRSEERARLEAEERNARERSIEDARESGERETERKKALATEERTRTLAIVGVIGAVTLVGGLISVFETKKKDAQTASTSATNTASTTRTTRTAKPAPTPAPPALVYVPSCTCATHDTSTKNTFKLEAPVTNSAWRFEWTQNAGFVETESTLMIHAIDGRTDNAPSPGSTNGASSSVHMGIACDGATVMLVAGNAARGYMSNDPGWTTALPSTFTPKIDSKITPTTAANTSIACAAPLAVDDGLVALTLDNGKRIHIAMKNGKLK